MLPNKIVWEAVGIVLSPPGVAPSTAPASYNIGKRLFTKHKSTKGFPIKKFIFSAVSGSDAGGIEAQYLRASPMTFWTGPESMRKPRPMSAVPIQQAWETAEDEHASFCR
jgi:hypothetical protein